jgi:hypothetical protein
VHHARHFCKRQETSKRASKKDVPDQWEVPCSRYGSWALDHAQFEYLCMYVFMHACICMYVCIHTCLCIRMYKWCRLDILFCKGIQNTKYVDIN